MFDKSEQVPEEWAKETRELFEKAYGPLDAILKTQLRLFKTNTIEHSNE